MASSGDEVTAQGDQRASNAGLAESGAGPVQRRQRSKEVQEVVDELAQETKRVTLLEREESQLKDQKHVSRVLFVFGIVDERKTQDAVEQEFAAWRGQQEGARNLTGLLLFCGQAAVVFMEGPTELIFKAVELFHGLTQEVYAAAAMPEPPSDMRAGGPPDRKLSTGPPAIPRAALISSVRVLYFTELHGVRATAGWCSLVNQAKALSGSAQVVVEDDAEKVFILYRKFLVLGLKVRDSVGEEANSDVVQGHYRKLTEMMPTPDEVLGILSKQSMDNFFTFAEFEKIFVKPFQLVLNSELLWPMPPPLSY